MFTPKKLFGVIVGVGLLPAIGVGAQLESRFVSYEPAPRPSPSAESFIGNKPTQGVSDFVPIYTKEPTQVKPTTRKPTQRHTARATPTQEQKFVPIETKEPEAEPTETPTEEENIPLPPANPGPCNGNACSEPEGRPTQNPDDKVEVNLEVAPQINLTPTP